MICRIIAAAIATATLLIGTGTAAWSDDELTEPTFLVSPAPNPLNIPGNETGGDVSSGRLAPMDAHEKKAMVERLNLMISAGAVSHAQATQQAKAEGIASLSGVPLSTTAGQGASTTAAAVIASTYPASSFVRLDHVAQINGYYCGPAAAYMILKTAGYSTSRHDGTALSQSRLATDTYLKTDRHGATKFDLRVMPDALGKWTGLWGSNRYVYLQQAKPTVGQVAFAAKYRIGHNRMAFAGSTVEFAGGPHYNNHPTNRLIGHWIAGFSYTANGNNIAWADPATSVYSGAAKTFSATTASFHQFLATNGVVY